MSNEIILAEDFAANENERKSIREFYKGITAVELHNDGLNALIRICPPEEFGEDFDCEELQNIIREMLYRIIELEAENKEMTEALKMTIILYHEHDRTPLSLLEQVTEIAKQSLKPRTINESKNNKWP
nr:hypothetical protein [Pedobacter sp. ASV19]